MKFSIVWKYTGFAFFGYLLLLSLSYSEDTAYQPIITLSIGILLWFCAKAIDVLNKKYGSTKIFLGILLIGGAIRFLWALLVPTEPVSDFLRFHESAIGLSQGTAVVYKNMGYPLLVSVGYRIYPSVLTGKLINAGASTISILFLYLIGSKLANRQTGLFAAFLFAILPSEIVMVSVLGTEVVVTMLGILTAFFLVRPTQNRLSLSILSIGSAGIFYGLGLTVRSSYLFYFPAILYWLIYISSFDFRQLSKRFVGFSIGTIIGLSMMLVAYSLSTKQFSIEPLRTQDSLPFLTGTNIATVGTWSQDDINLYSSWPVDKRDTMARQEAVRRIKSNPIGFLFLVPKKINILMASNDYGNYWSLNDLDWGKEKLLIALLSQGVYVILLLFSLSAFKKFQNNSPILGIALIMTVSTLLPHIILEVQSRYHHYIMPFIVLLASEGIQGNNNMG